MTRQRTRRITGRRRRNSILDWGSTTTYRRRPGQEGEFEHYAVHPHGYGFRRKRPTAAAPVPRTKAEKKVEEKEDMATLNAIAKQHAGKSFKSLRDDEKALVRSLAERMKNPGPPVRSTAKTALHWYDRGTKTAYDWTAGLPSRIAHSLIENPMQGHEEHCGCNPAHIGIRGHHRTAGLWPTPGVIDEAINRRAQAMARTKRQYTVTESDKAADALINQLFGRNAQITNAERVSIRTILWNTYQGYEPGYKGFHRERVAKAGRRKLKELGYLENPRISISGKDPATMTAGEVNKELDRLYKIDSQLTDEMIAAGRGHERPSDYWPAKPGDTLAEQKQIVSDRLHLLRWQIEKEYGPGAPSRFPHGWKRSSKRNPGPSDRYLDLLKQGFMKQGRGKKRKQTMYRAMTPHGATYTGPDKWEAERHVREYGGKVEVFKENPESGADRMYEIFHGRPPQTDIIVEEEIHEHEHLATLGKMVSLKVETRSGYLVEIGWEDDDFHPYLACNEKGTQLYIEGGDQNVDLASFKMDGPEWRKELMVIGDLVESTYETEKDFDHFETIDYYHANGEESGEVPQLLYDPLSKADKSSRPGKLYIAGGRYRIEHDGIID